MSIGYSCQEEYEEDMYAKADYEARCQFEDDAEGYAMMQLEEQEKQREMNKMNEPMKEQEIKAEMAKRELSASVEISAGSAAKGQQFTIKFYMDGTDEQSINEVMTHFYKTVADAKSRGFLQ